ncbi:bifunctional tRNA (5-methylaminomethyl-2-thiouridine)(34)-methyltransferase MnmD/FAD-dependent 5-carboxymethylaminomethyl-2-thiouridine(34) oxidoreductase MnmC [Alteromonas gilva]|uniref:tRNA 5-methylaminomethyl-2-thiouridine biosynthesis bifunctional protein MnmC n=1 Tax=Alteromonas gilva TaxID=2987522 RepID=A0ABT5L2I0_9ALTE|nr:bifunctional tRNA (5-methylaminomethyl-2-thiouridine)(34)-methyltransferase MnmD/FAD-dependent 5-carboxymethylaminomethyl-2-thiouridine(34) oxidoreductase MnmC [Alteromonas gilva]MDC8830634.1 bifunctional tRNA (5-methylaminomethyl-2-thiouridine)(34)-methyltransferase MnmD/FAD-dependent 5-carboxymethylaminomethyl-2-thiouridine(34) oxidoreductase MnmC [Alteromonas gilva]
MTNRLRTANVHFNSLGTPVADSFDDVYFSNDSGIDETRHVFIDGNDITQRWQAWQQPHFVIAETGFGTGLNCLITMALFKQFRAANPSHPLKRLFIVTTEKYPINASDLQQALAVFPAVGPQVNKLIELYPAPLPGCHRLAFSEWHTTIDLWLGDIHDLLPQWHCPHNGLVDAWFLDGFAPSKNPDMWSDTLFTQMARLSKPGATFATFTAAGIVKRGLKAAGFSITKRKGFGRKRDMLTGELETPPARRTNAPWHYRYPTETATNNEHIAIVGAGLAGSSLALALCTRGIKVSLFGHGPGPADGASGNRQGGLYPQLQASLSNPAQIQAHGFLYAKRYYDALSAAGLAFEHDNCGVLLLGFNDEVKRRQQKLINNDIWPEELVTAVSAEQASELSGIGLSDGGLFIRQGGWICPAQLVAAQLQAARDTGLLTEHYNARVTLAGLDDTAQVTRGDTVYLTAGEQRWQANRVVLASGHECAGIDALAHLPLRPVRGQVEALPAQAPINQLKTVLCHKGYLTPDWQGRHALGSTYVKGDTDTTPREAESTENLAIHAKALAHYDWSSTLTHDNHARAAIRLGTADHQPIVGGVIAPQIITERYEDLYKGKHVNSYPEVSDAQRLLVLTGLGSRGLTTAPLMAEVLASQLSHEPLPMSETLLQALAPERFQLRNLRRPVQ